MLRFTLALFLIPFFGYSQYVPVSPNKLDENGLRTGHWTILYDSSFEKETTNLDSARFYRLVKFEAGKPIGKVRDFFRTGQKKQEVYLKSISPDVFDGPCLSFHQNGKVKDKLTYQNGKINGLYQEFSPTGKLIRDGMLKDGAYVDKWNFYDENEVRTNETIYIDSAHQVTTYFFPSGKVEGKGNWLNDQREGVWVYYYEDGTLKSKCDYKNGLRDGKWEWYNAQGVLEESGMYRNDKKFGYWETYYDGAKYLMQKGSYDTAGRSTGPWVYYYPNGNKKSEGEMLNNGNEGPWKFYHSNGKLSAEGNLSKGKYEGIIKFYSESGALVEKSGYSRDTLHGHFISYFENGNIKAEGEKVYDKKDGLWKYYLEGGTLDAEEDLRLGNLHGRAINYYANGKIKDIGYFKDGKRDSLYISYFINGQIESTGYYENGLREGNWTWYFENGQLSGQYIYVHGDYEGLFRSFHNNGAKWTVSQSLHSKLHGWTERYFSNGQLNEEGLNINGKPQGKWKSYDSLTGNVIAITHFENGKRHGLARYYKSNGKKDEFINYIHGFKETPYNIRDSVYKLVKLNLFDQAWKCAEWADRVAKKYYNKNDKAQAVPPYLKAYIYQYGRYDYEKALPHLLENIRLVEKLEGKNSANYASSLNDLANLYGNVKRHAEALPIYDSLLAQSRRENDLINYNVYLYNKAVAYKQLGRAPEADQLFSEEVAQLEARKGKTHPDVFALRQKWSEYNYDWNFSENILPVLRQLYDDVSVIDPLSDIGLYCVRKTAYSYNAFSQRTNAVYWLKKTIDLVEKKDIPEFENYFSDMGLLANNYLNLSYLDSANLVYQKMNDVLTSRNLLNSRFEAILLDGKAEIYFVQYQYDRAQEIWLHAKQILEVIGYEKSELYADVLRAVALVYNAKDNNDEAVKLYEKGLSIYGLFNTENSRSYIESEIVLAGLYKDKGENTKAKALLENIFKKIGDTPTRQQQGNHASANNKMADLIRAEYDYQGAIQYNEKALAYYESNKANDISTYTDVLRDIAYDYRKLNDYANAEKFLLKSLSAAEEVIGKENMIYMDLRWSLARQYQAQELYLEAEKIYNEVLKAFEKMVGKNNTTYSHALRNLASNYLDASDYPKAELAYTKFLDLTASFLGTQSYDYLDALEVLGKVKYNLDKNDEAEALYLKSLQIAKSILGEKHSDYAYYLKEVAQFYYNTNRAAAAEETIALASRVMQEHPDYGPNSVAYSRYTLLHAKILSWRDKNQEAEELLQRTLTITAPKKETNFYDHINALESLAGFYEKMGQYRNAEKTWNEIINLTEQRSGKDFDYQMKRFSLVNLFYSVGKFDEVVTQGKELLTYFENELSMSHYTVRDIHNLIGLAELELRNFDAAAAHFKYCMEVLELAKATNTSYYATYLNNYSLTAMAKGDFITAEKLLLQSAELRKNLKVELSPVSYAVITDNYAGLYQAWGKLDKSEKYWLDVTNTLIRYARQNFYFLSDEEKAQFWNDIKADFEYFNTFAVLRSKQNPAILGDMYNNQLETKAILLSASNKIKKRILSSRDQEMIRHYYDWVDVRERLAQLYTSTESELKTKKPFIDSLELSAKNIEKELNISAEDLAQDKGGQSKVTTWREVQRSLTQQEAAVEIIRFRYYDRYLRDSVIYAALVLTSETKQNPKLVLLPDGKKLETRAIKYYKNAIAAHLEDKFSYQQFWQPLEAALAGKTRIYLSLDGVYNQINLNTLADSDGKFLVESKNLTIVSNTKDLLLLKSKRTTRAGVATASLFGYPKYFLGKQRIKEKAENLKRDLDLAALDDQDATGIAELPGTQTEIRQVKNILDSHHWQTTNYTDELATEKALKSIDFPRVLHIATHGFFVDEKETSSTFKLGAAAEYAKQNPLLRSGLLLSGASNYIQNNFRLEEENGILTAYEAANLNLDKTDLVVLSACETGKGEVQNGEGVYGLQRAFQTAGAQAIIMSLWKVDDAATQQLMTAFYQHWMNGTAKSEAFRLAQLQLKNTYNHPYYWGAFVMMGN